VAQDRDDERGKRGKRDSDLDLSIGQVLAATGASTFGAVLAKVLNLWGTVAGTALLSICASIGTVLILRAIRRTGDRIKEQLVSVQANRPADSPTVSIAADGTTRFTATATIPRQAETEDATLILNGAPSPGDATVLLGNTVAADDATKVMGPPASEPPDDSTVPVETDRKRSPKKTLTAIAVSSVIVFALTIGTLYLIGSLTGQPGRFIEHSPAVPETVTEAPAEDAPAAEAPTKDTAEEPTEPVETEAPTTDAPTEAPTESPTEAPTTDPADETTSEAPATAPSPEASESPATDG
jgi:hypothetical protein